jgi:hypothetical protein
MDIVNYDDDTELNKEVKKWKFNNEIVKETISDSTIDTYIPRNKLKWPVTQKRAQDLYSEFYGYLGNIKHTRYDVKYPKIYIPKKN